MITTVLIDYDGTLHDWDSVLTRSLDGILGLKGSELLRIWIFDIHRAIVHARHMDKHDDMMFHCELLFQRLGRPFEKRTADLICRRFEEAGDKAMDDPIYFPDAIPALDELKKMGLKLCLSTGMHAERKAETLARTTGNDYFDHVFSEHTIGYFKTEPKYYRIALEWSDSKPEHTVSVGDTPLSDIRPAKLTGIRTIWLNRRGEPKPAVEDQRPDREAADLLQAVEIIQNWM